MTAASQGKAGGYPAILSYGFRPFFLLGAAYGALVILVWLPILHGALRTHSSFYAVDWHVHESLFGYVAAVIAGFLLTAIPNWTGRLPVQGLPLLMLVLLWLAGRVAVFFSGDMHWIVALAIDSAFLTALATAAAVEIVAGRNWRNLMVLVPVSLLLASNVLFHMEVRFNGISDVSRRLAIGIIAVLITIIGGRVIPSFTRNWLARENPGRLPAPFGRFDGLSIVLAAVALAAWSLAPNNRVTGILLVIAAGVHLVRLARWAGDRTLRDPLVLILHAGYFFVPLGLLLAALGALFHDHTQEVAAIHVLGVGAMGTMTLAVMTRATLGHTGHALRADTWTCLIYVFIVLAALTRLAAVFWPMNTSLLHTAATLWSLSFLAFCLRYGRMLIRARA
ncbi:NnrS family protein [Roseiarcaceae bacterium H3SJ34-1]|uniref:NnrS family protein n=1 Tax=Terripilifer ovatus TaxID=3032367 RepID=UPI003AB93C13|nr:NnrS family protein [Roseiarcaceae bacterium H3SJ34-1]